MAEEDLKLEGTGSKIEPSPEPIEKVYTVFMGALPEGNYHAKTNHIAILEKVMDRSCASKNIIYSYDNLFNGFVIRMTEESAEKIAGMEGVISVFLSGTPKLETTVTWDSLGLTLHEQNQNVEKTNIIIGILDSGICCESKFFKSAEIQPLVDTTDPNFNCTDKIVHAKIYTKGDGHNSIRDFVGHGTACAAVAAGNVVDADFGGLLSGKARGGFPSARIGVYKVLCSEGHKILDLLRAFEDAIKDGVHVLSVSLSTGKSIDKRRKSGDYWSDDIAIGTFYAMRAGILSCVSAGNYKYSGTIRNCAPWQLCCGSSMPRKIFETKVKLGAYGYLSITGFSINRFDSGFCELIYATEARKRIEPDASSCSSSRPRYTLDKKLTKDKILVYRTWNRGIDAHQAGAKGIILVIPDKSSFQSAIFPLAAACVTQQDGVIINYYIKRIRNSGKVVPSCQICRSNQVNNPNYSTLAKFSSKGPNSVSPYILKPDICAPGVNILTAASNDVPGEYPCVLMKGTSISTAMVAGAVAYLKSIHPNWSPAALKSSLMTTATRMKRENSLDVLGFGAGIMKPNKAADPGLIYDISPEEYERYLVGEGYSEGEINLVTGDYKQLAPLAPWDLNLPSFTACLPRVGDSIIFSRRVTHVAPNIPPRFFKAVVSCSTSLEIDVEPKFLNFRDGNKTQDFQVTVTVRDWEKCEAEEDGVLPASLEWRNGKYRVKSPVLIVRQNEFEV